MRPPGLSPRCLAPSRPLRGTQPTPLPARRRSRLQSAASLGQDWAAIPLTSHNYRLCSPETRQAPAHRIRGRPSPRARSAERGSCWHRLASGRQRVHDHACPGDHALGGLGDIAWIAAIPAAVSAISSAVSAIAAARSSGKAAEHAGNCWLTDAGRHLPGRAASYPSRDHAELMPGREDGSLRLASAMRAI